jgi:hypothetical protein
VDFLLPGRGGSLALVECKAGRTVTPAMAVPMQRLAEALKRKRARTAVSRFLVHREPKAGAPTQAVSPGVRALPWRRFLDEL